MANLEKHIENIGWRFVGMKKENTAINGVTETITRIEIDFKANLPNYKWEVFGLPTEANVQNQIIKCVKRKTNDDVYYLFTSSKEYGFIDLINHAQKIIDVNTSIEEKRTLLTLKMEELNKLFGQLEYSELKTLTFKYKAKRKKKVDEVIEPTVEQKIEEPINNENKENKIEEK